MSNITGFGLLYLIPPYVFSRFLNLQYKLGVLLASSARAGCGLCWAKDGLGGVILDLSEDTRAQN
jgi:hypothetical protein